MDEVGAIVLIIFIIARLMIAIGILYLIIYEIRRLRKPRKRKMKNHEETDKDGHGKNVGGSSGGGN